MVARSAGSMETSLPTIPMQSPYMQALEDYDLSIRPHQSTGSAQFDKELNLLSQGHVGCSRVDVRIAVLINSPLHKPIALSDRSGHETA